MSSQHIYQKIRENPRYRSLVQDRRRLAFSLSAIVLIPYALFIAAVSWQPHLLMYAPQEGKLTVGIWAALILIVGSWLLTGLYVLRANNAFDKATEQLLAEVKA